MSYPFSERTISRDKTYLEYARKYPHNYPGPKKLFEDHFEFNSLTYSVYRRFIELLLPITNHFFRKTSKHNYQQCLDLRGIEVGHLTFDGYPASHGLCVPSGETKLDFNHIQGDWIKCLVVTTTFSTAGCSYKRLPDIQQLNFVKKYKILSLCHAFAEQLEHFLHADLKEVDIDFHYLEFDQLLRCLNKLNVCQHLEVVSITSKNVKSTAVFLKLKQYLEQLSRRHQHAQIDCRLDRCKNFRVRQHVLMYRTRQNQLVQYYNFEDLSKLSNCPVMHQQGPFIPHSVPDWLPHSSPSHFPVQFH